MIDSTTRPGVKVRYIGPALFRRGKGWIGKLVRPPIPRERLQPGDEYPGYCLVQRGTEKRPRPIRPDCLEIV